MLKKNCLKNPVHKLESNKKTKYNESFINLLKPSGNFT
jgi:hypothetical protein